MAKLITSLIAERLFDLGISLAPVAHEKSAPDVLLVVTRKGRKEDGTKAVQELEEEEEVVKVLAHSNVLKNECDFFREWFLAHEQRNLKEQQQRSVVTSMVQNLMENVRQEGETWQAISNLVEDVMSNVRLENPEGDEEAGPPPLPEERKDHAKDYASSVAEDDEDDVHYTVIKMLNWSLPVAVAILEWIYTRVAHIDIKDLSSVYLAADRMVFPSLTCAIRDLDSVLYYRHALACDGLRDGLLCLSRRAACPELAGLQLLCESLQRSVNFFAMTLETASIPYRNQRDIIPEGMFTLNGIPVCCLRDSSPPVRHYLTYVRETRRRTPQRSGGGRSSSWRITDFGGDASSFCHAVFHFTSETSGRAARAAGMLSKPTKRESFSLRMVTGSMVSNILRMALRKAIPGRGDLTIKIERGSGYYIRGPSYSFSLVLEGDPGMILVGAKAIPSNLVGRVALRIRSPSLRTFRSFLPVLASFGVDLEAKTMYIIKTLPCIIRILEFATGLCSDGFLPIDVERRVVELVEPTDPF